MKTKDFLVQEFVNLQKWPILHFGHSNSYKRLETKEKSTISDALCLVVGMDAQITSQHLISYRLLRLLMVPFKLVTLLVLNRV